MRITGLMINYYFVCKRRLWYLIHEINLENENEDVMIGKEIDENTYRSNDKHITINDEISIDFIKNNIICETKKSKSKEESGIWQLKYYLYYLKKRGVFISGQIKYPLLKETVNVELSAADEEKIEQIIKEIQEMRNSSNIYSTTNTKKFCKKCAYFDLCFI